MNKDKDFLGTEPVGKLMFRLALPTITAQLINMLYNIIDRIYIGHIPGNGALALTGVGVCMPLIMIISAFAALVGGGGAPHASIAMGKNDLNTAEHILGNCFFLQILISIILTVILLFGNRTFLLAFGASENTIEYAVNYMNIYAVGTIFVQLTLGMNMFITTQGFAKTGMLSVLIGAVMNIVLDPLFIFGFHWSVAGAAGASLISRMTACFILMWRLRDPKLDIRIGTTKGVNMRMVKQILHIGIPNGIENSIFQLGRVLTVSIIAMFGTTQIAANAIANNLDSMGVLPGTAMCLAIITVVGRCVGADDFEQAEYYTKKMMKLTYVINGICCLVVILTMPVTLRLYGVSGETRHLGAVLALIHNGCAIFLWPAGFCLPNVMRAANDVKFPMCVSIASMFIFRIGLSYVTGVAMGLGAIGVWIAMIIDWIVRISFFVTRFFSGKWKTFYHGE